MDEKYFEMAAEQEERERVAGIKRAQLANLPEHQQRLANGDLMYPGFDGTCVGCGDEIPEGRLALGKVRCVVCQTIKERRAKGL